MEIQIEFFSQQMKNLREAKQLTQEELAHELGVSRQSVIALERGKCLPSLPLALSLSQVFDLALESFFCPTKQDNKENREEVSLMPRDLMPFSPMRDLTSLHESIDRLFEESLPTLPKMNLSLPAVNVYEKDNQIIVEAEIPGVKEEDLTIELSEDHLLIKGEKKTEQEIEEKDYHRIESSYGSFSRAIGLPLEVDKDNVDATLSQGVLTIRLNKLAKAEPKLTKIKVKSK